MYLFHASSSLSLIGLTMSDYQLLPLHALIEEHHFAPLAGEIFAGGSKGLSVKNGLAFAAQGSNTYPLQRLLSHYGNYGYKGETLDKETITSLVKQLLQSHCTTVFEFIVRLMRAQQMGQAYRFKPEALTELFKAIDEKAKGLKQHILANYMIPVFLVKEGRLHSEAQSWVKDIFKQLTEQVPLDFLSRPLKAQMILVNYHFILVKESIAKQYQIATDEIDKVISAQSDLTFLQQAFKQTKISSLEDDGDWLRITDMPTATTFIDNCFHGNGKSPSGFWQPPAAILKSVQDLLDYFNKKIATVKKILAHQYATELDEQTKTFCQQSFPVVFIANTSKLKKESILKLQGEYRYSEPMRLSKEISMLATTTEHLTQLERFVKEAGLAMPVVDVRYLDKKRKPTLAFIEKHHRLPQVRLFPYLPFFSCQPNLAAETALPYQIAATSLILATVSFIATICVMHLLALALAAAALSAFLSAKTLAHTVDNEKEDAFIQPTA